MREWRKSSYSNNNGCFELTAFGDIVAVRDSKDVNGPVLEFTRRELAVFLAGIHAGEFTNLAA